MSSTPPWFRLLVLVCLASRGVLSQQLSVKSLNTDAGLPQSNVAAVLQTRDSYLWVGTEGGLARFDGLRFVTFHTSTTPAFDSDSIRCLFEDHAGALWIGTEAGLVRLIGNRFERIGLAGRSVRVIIACPAGGLWIGTYGDGLYHWNGVSLRRVDRPDDLPTPRITSLCTDQRGRLWIGTEWTNGPTCFEGGRFFRDPALQELPGRITAMCCDPEGVLWLGSYHHGLYRLQDGQLSESLRTSGMIITDIRSAVGGGLWVTAGKVFKAPDRRRPQFQRVSQIQSDQARMLCEDREGGIWLGCGRGEGLLLARAIPYRAITMSEGLPGDAVRTVSGDRDGNLWLTILNCQTTRVAPDGSVKIFGPADGFPAGEPTLVYAGTDGRIWAGIGGKLFEWKAGAGQSYPKINSVYGVYEDSRHAVWIGTRTQGLFCSIPGSPEPVCLFPHILYATSFCELPDESLLVGTWETGIYRIKNGRILEIMNRTNGLPVDEVRALFIDSKGIPWAGLKGRGLAPYVDGKWWNPNLLSEAVADHVSAIAEDRRGEFWLGTAAGILHASRDDILAGARGSRPVPNMRVTTANGGASAAAAWSGTQPGVWATEDQTYIFATRHGLVEVDPSRVPKNPVAPPVQIENVELDRRSAGFSRGLEIPAGTRNVAITYTALSFVQPARILFQYRLEGYDADWVDAETRRTASYSHLPPGRYSFKVRACNNDGVWNAQGASLEFEQLPFFYQTIWFKTLAVLGFFAAIWGGNRLSHRGLLQTTERLEARHAMERERNRIAKSLHDDLGANLTALGLLAERIRSEATDQNLEADIVQLRRRVGTLIESLDAVVWTTNPANDSLDQVVLYISGLFQDLLSLAGIRARLDVQANIPAVPLTPEARSDLFLIAKEAAHNVVKHSGASEGWLRIRWAGREFALTIEDNGCGLGAAKSRDAQRNGIANMTSRVAELGGLLKIQSEVGLGTVVKITVPL